MDPVGTLMGVYELIKDIRNAVECVYANKAQCLRLTDRVESVQTLLGSHFPMTLTSGNFDESKISAVRFPYRSLACLEVRKHILILSVTR